MWLICNENRNFGQNCLLKILINKIKVKSPCKTKVDLVKTSNRGVNNQAKVKMGILRFFKFLQGKYPRLVLKNLFSQKDKAGVLEDKKDYVEGLYIDLNSSVHRTSGRTFMYGLDRELVQEDLDQQEKFRNMPVEERKKILFNNIGYYLLYAYLTVRPKKVFMIAVDGPAPKAKMVQQRFRRYVPTGAPLDFFDPVVISPGTKFMDDLDRYLSVEWPETYRSQFDRDLDIIYSSHREPGEGEHKIFEQLDFKLKGRDMTKLANNFNTKRLTPYNVILGLDSDLIVLALAKAGNIIFMRDLDVKDKTMDPLERAIRAVVNPPCDWTPQQKADLPHQAWLNCFENGFTYTDMTELRNKLLQDFMNPGGSTGTNEIADFAMITFFVGNDFLPAIPELEIATTLGYQFFSDDDIKLRYLTTADRQNHTKAGLGPDGKPWRNRKGQGDDRYEVDSTQLIDSKKLSQKVNPAVDSKRFEALFQEKSITWNNEDGSVNFRGAKGLRNEEMDQYEMFPFMKMPLTGVPRRVLYIKRASDRQWTAPMEDIGAMQKCLKIYSILTKRIRKGARGRANSFIVERKDRINYINLLTYLQEIQGHMEEFMDTLAVQYDFMERNPKPGRGKPDPIIKSSVGIETTGKRKKIPALVPATFSALHKARAFGIYDAKYADVKLSKQTIDEMCRKWLEGAQWVLKYYNDGLRTINTQWFYPFQYSPTVVDLINYLEARLVVEIPGYPLIRCPAREDQVEIKQITIDGIVNQIMRPDPNNPNELVLQQISNKSVSGVIESYLDQSGQTVSVLKLTNGEEKYIDLDQINFVKTIKTLVRGVGLGGVDMKSNVEGLDMSKTNLIETKRLSVFIPVERTFILQDEIYETIADTSQPYASILECFFSIMPERVLKMMLSPWLVDFVISQLSDCFPKTFEVIKHGKFYENNAVPRIPLVSPTRLQRALDSIPPEFDLEIGRYNNIKTRQRILHKGTLGVTSKVVTTSVSQGTSTAANISAHTLRKQDAQEVPVSELTSQVTGGIGDLLGGVLPQYVQYYNSLFGPISVQKQLMTDAELAESRRLKSYKLSFDAFTPQGSLTSPNDLVINYTSLPTNIPYRERPEIKEKDTTTYSGQRKLAIHELTFLTKYGHLSRKIVYVGAAPGIHIPILAKLFPMHKFDLWDPAPFTIPEQLTTAKNKDANIQIFAKPFTFETALSYRGQDVLLICDLRNLSTGHKFIKLQGKELYSAVEESILNPESGQAEGFFKNTQRNIMVDNLTQFAMYDLMRPKMASMKFRLAYDYDIKQIFPAGEIWLQPWAFSSSAEVRLILSSADSYPYPVSNFVDGLGLKDSAQRASFTSKLLNSLPPGETNVLVHRRQEYDLKTFENKLYYFNLFFNNPSHIIKLANPLGITDKDLPGFAADFRCTYEVYAIDQYLLTKFPESATHPGGLAYRKQKTIEIINDISRVLGKDLLLNKTGTGPLISRAPFDVKF